MKKYIGKYRVFSPIDSNGKVTSNEFDTYIKGKYKTEVYRYSDNLLAIYFVANQTARRVISYLESMGVQCKKFNQGDFESVWLFDEQYIDIVDSILKFSTQGKNIKPTSIKTMRKLKKNHI